MSTNALSRRAFLARSGAVIGGGALLLGGGLAGLRRLSGVAAAQTPPWPEPRVLRSRNGKLATRLRVAETDVRVGGQPARALTYEGQYPAPTIEIEPGDQLDIDLINDAADPTNLHTHGLHISPKSPADNVLLNITKGDRFAYSYDLPDDHPGGTFWYHAHRHMLTDVQVFGGLFGMLIVRGDIDELPGIEGLEERAFIMSQSEVVDGKMANPEVSSLSDQVTLVNAELEPTVTMKAGETQRWRLVNTSVVFLRIELEGNDLNTIAIDGNTLPAPASQRLIEIPPGGRADVLVRAPKAGQFRLNSLSWRELGVFYTSMVPNAQVLANLIVTGPDAEPDPLPTKLLPVEDLSGLEVDRKRTFRLEELEPRGVGPPNAFAYYINGRVFDPSYVNEQIPLGAIEEWEFVNVTYEPHPLHIHVNPFQVVAIDGDRSRAENHYRDTALVPPFGSLTIRHRFTDFTGLTVMHCHILFHEDEGMMQLLEIYDPEKGPGPQRLPHRAMDHPEMTAAPGLLCDINDLTRS